jgi:hypothetical protein
MTVSVEELMTETHEHGAPFFFATGKPPTVAAIDDDICLTVKTAVLNFLGKAEQIDIAVSVEYAKAVISRLSTAVIAAPERAAMISVTPLRPRLRA